MWSAKYFLYTKLQFWIFTNLKTKFNLYRKNTTIIRNTLTLVCIWWFWHGAKNIPFHTNPTISSHLLQINFRKGILLRGKNRAFRFLTTYYTYKIELINRSFSHMIKSFFVAIWNLFYYFYYVILKINAQYVIWN